MNKNKLILWLKSGLFLLILIYLFQNCAQQPLEKVEKASLPYQAPMLKFSSSFCPIVRTGTSTTTKFVFIVDLSASNFGDWIIKSSSGYDYYYWDKSKATDYNGARFESIKTFVDTCAQSLSTSYAIIGFSNAAGVISGGNFSCTNVQFQDEVNFKSNIDIFKSRQATDAKWYEQWTEPNYLKVATPDSIIFKGTSYSSAMNCLEDLITKDLNSEASADIYNVFFISDGKPQDKKGTGCNLTSLSEEEKATCYLNTALDPLTYSRTASISKAKKFILGSVYYGVDTEIPSVLTSMSKEGGTSGATQINSFENDPDAICKMVLTQFSTEFRPDSYVITPLTVLRKNGNLAADSDMDGVSDEDEIQLGLDPTNPRSIVPGILDGICMRLGGASKCDETRQTISCNKDIKNELGLTDCDYRILGLDSLSTQGSWGVDSDGDGFNDYLEIVKGLDPSKADLLLDFDNDGFNNKEEVLRGTDPFNTDHFLDVTSLNEIENGFHFDSRRAECPLGSYYTSLNRMQVQKTLATQLHGENEHLLMVQVRYSPSNSSTAKKEFFGSFVRVKLKYEIMGKDNFEILTPEVEQLPQSSLIKWGELW